MMRLHSRRTFLARGIQGAGLIGLATWPARFVAVGGEVPDAAELAAKAVAFLRPRQGKDGSWSGDREPGITALVVTAMLRSGQVTPDDPAVTKGLAFLERYIGPKGGLSEAPHSVYTTSVALMAFHEANRGGRYDRIIKGGQEFLKIDPDRRGRRQGSRRSGLWRAGLRRRQQPAGPLEHRVLHRGPPRHRPASRRPGAPEGADLRLAVPEPQERVQRPAPGRQGQRRRLRLQPRRGKRGQRRPGARRPRVAARRRPGRRRRPPLLRRDDLRGPQEHDLRGPHPGRPARQGGHRLHQEELHPGGEPRPGPARALLLLPDVRQGDGPPRASRRSWTPRDRSTTGGPSSSPPWPSGRTPTAAGSTGMTASWRATRTS